MPRRKKCEWYFEKDIVVSAELSGDDRKTLKKLLRALLKAADVATAELKALLTAIEKLGPAKNLVKVTLVYACENEEGKFKRQIKELTDTENLNWSARLFDTPAATDRRMRLMNKNRPPGSCCKSDVTRIARRGKVEKNQTVSVTKGRTKSSLTRKANATRK